jgi:hypothetical protein
VNDTMVRVHCGGCDASWTGLGKAHCAACHFTFSGVTAFDMHRRHARVHPVTGDRTDPPYGFCVKPWLVTDSTGHGMLRRDPDGVWRSATERPAGLWR